MTLPFSQACENNKQPILNVLRPLLANSKRVLEVGSGTGQHAVYFAPALPWLEWQPSDLAENHPGINAWRQAHPHNNLPAPLLYDLRHSQWPGAFDAVFSANTAHIMAWPLVQRFVEEAGHNLPPNGLFVLYGPFNYQGRYTSESNERFDAFLRSRNPEQGIRDFEAINTLAEQAQLRLEQDNALPANNRLLVWRKYGS